MTTKTVESLVGSKTYEQLTTLVHAVFVPQKDAHAVMPGEQVEGLSAASVVVDNVIAALPAEAQIALGIAQDALPAVGDLAVKAQIAWSRALGRERGIVQAIDPATRYFVATATHERIGVGAHRFAARLPMVLVTLPESELTDFETDFGEVYAGDHKLPTCALFREKYQEHFPAPIRNVHLLTPARFFGARFAAIATYIVDFAPDESGVAPPQAWVLEGGMATGEAMVLYASPRGWPVDRTAWYQPTPFSNSEHVYHGEVHLAEDGTPQRCNIEVRTRAVKMAGGPAHVAIRTVYEDVTAPVGGLAPEDVKKFPAELTAEAALRVAAIAVARGSLDPLMHILAPFGRALTWEKAPR